MRPLGDLGLDIAPAVLGPLVEAAEPAAQVVLVQAARALGRRGGGGGSDAGGALGQPLVGEALRPGGRIGHLLAQALRRGAGQGLPGPGQRVGDRRGARRGGTRVGGTLVAVGADGVRARRVLRPRQPHLHRGLGLGLGGDRRRPGGCRSAGRRPGGRRNGGGRRVRGLLGSGLLHRSLDDGLGRLLRGRSLGGGRGELSRGRPSGAGLAAPPPPPRDLPPEEPAEPVVEGPVPESAAEEATHAAAAPGAATPGAPSPDTAGPGTTAVAAESEAARGCRCGCRGPDAPGPYAIGPDRHERAADTSTPPRRAGRRRRRAAEPRQPLTGTPRRAWARRCPIPAPVPERLTDKGLLPSAPNIAAPPTPGPPADGGLDEDDLRRRLGGFRRGPRPATASRDGDRRTDGPETQDRLRHRPGPATEKPHPKKPRGARSRRQAVDRAQYLRTSSEARNLHWLLTNLVEEVPASGR